MLSRWRSTTGSTRTSRSSEPGRRSTRLTRPIGDALGEEALRDAGGDDAVTVRDAGLGVHLLDLERLAPAPAPHPAELGVLPGYRAETSGPTSGAAAGAVGAAVAAAAAVGRRRGRRRSAARVGRPAAPWWSSSWCRPARRSRTGRWRSGHRRSTPGSERRRTTDWRSVTCSMRPTRPPEVITGMPTVIALATALVDGDRLVEVRRRPGDDLGLHPVDARTGWAGRTRT